MAVATWSILGWRIGMNKPIAFTVNCLLQIPLGFDTKLLTRQIYQQSEWRKTGVCFEERPGSLRMRLVTFGAQDLAEFLSALTLLGLNYECLLTTSTGQ